MQSKGVQYYGYLGGSEYGVTVTQPADQGKSTTSHVLGPPQTMVTGSLQISEEDIDPSGHTGRFQWTADQNGTALMSQYADIAPSTGSLGASSLGVMLNTPSVVQPGYALSYGFYDAGPGYGALTSQDQSYAYLTANHARWMGDMVAAEPDIAELPFGTLVLPGAHDCGMFDPTAVQSLLEKPDFLVLLAELIGVEAALLTVSVAMRAVVNLAFTQKDDITTMLNLGVRYFDFRPGYCFMGILPGIYHQHSFIPGYPYASFLNDVLTWLAANPTEIVVVSLNFQGFQDVSMHPPVETLTGMIATAQQQTGAQGIMLGDRIDLDLGTSIASLLQQNKRLIFLNQIGAPDDASKYDSYSGAYGTATVGPIIGALEGMTAAGQVRHDYTVLQLQGTATALGGAIISAILSQGSASSPLMSTKAAFDSATYPWVQANVPANLSYTQLVVLLNDFADNALTEYAMGASLGRAVLMATMPMRERGANPL